jgi:hypothetical protein
MDVLEIVAPRFDTALPPLTPAVYPPQMKDPPVPVLELFDLDDAFASSKTRLTQLTQRANRKNAKKFTVQAAKILGSSRNCRWRSRWGGGCWSTCFPSSSDGNGRARIECIKVDWRIIHIRPFLSTKWAFPAFQMSFEPCDSTFAVVTKSTHARSTLRCSPARVDAAPLRYLAEFPAFRALISSGVTEVMCAYNRIFGQPAPVRLFL